MDKLFITILNNALVASWIIVAVIICRQLFKKAPKWINCILWGLVAIRLAVPFSIESIFSLVPSAKPVPVDIEYAKVPQINSGIPAINTIVNPVLENNFVANEVASANPMQIVIFILSYVWIIGVAGLCIYAVVSFFMIKRRVRTAQMVEKGIYACDSIESPFILGIVRPHIYFPVYMDEESYECVLEHEKAHIKRLDHIWKPLGFLILAVYWFNPLCWIAYIMLCKDIEYACDEKVTRDKDKDWKAKYCQVLLDCSSQRRLVSACPVAFGEVSVKDRIKSVIDYKKPAFWIIVATVVISVIVAVCFMTNPKKEESTEEENLIEIADLDGNGKAELIGIEEVTPQELYSLKVIKDDGTILFATELGTPHVAWNSYWLYQRGDVTGVLEYNPSEFQGLSNYYYKLYTFEGGESTVYSSNQVEFDTNPGNDGEWKEDVNAFAEDVNSLLDNSVVLISTLNGELHQYGDDFSLRCEVPTSYDMPVLEYEVTEAQLFVEMWADAFCKKDGEVLYKYSSDDVRNALAIEEVKGEYVFGESSPWPWDGWYRIEELYDNSAMIDYYALTSDPHVTVWRQYITFANDENTEATGDIKYLVKTVNIDKYENIVLGSDFDLAYRNGLFWMDYNTNGLGETLNSNALLSSSMAYKDLFEPDTAARYLLNLLKNDKKVPIVVMDGANENEKILNITFMEDNQVRTVKMIRSWGNTGIWIPAGMEDEENDEYLEFDGIIVENTIESLVPIILVENISGDNSVIPYDKVMFELPKELAAWENKVGTKVRIVCHNEFAESMPAQGSIVKIDELIERVHPFTGEVRLEKIAPNDSYSVAGADKLNENMNVDYVEDNGQYIVDGDMVFMYKKVLVGKQPSAACSVQYIVLTNDENITWEEVDRSLYSSNSNDWLYGSIIIGINPIE